MLSLQRKRPGNGRISNYKETMNLRDFKKDVEYAVGEFVDDCALFICTNPKHDSERTEAILNEAIDLYNEFKDKACVKAEGNKKAYFNGLRKDMLERVDALYERLSAEVASTRS